MVSGQLEKLELFEPHRLDDRLAFELRAGIIRVPFHEHIQYDRI